MSLSSGSSRSLLIASLSWRIYALQFTQVLLHTWRTKKVSQRTKFSGYEDIRMKRGLYLVSAISLHFIHFSALSGGLAGLGSAPLYLPVTAI